MLRDLSAVIALRSRFGLGGLMLTATNLDHTLALIYDSALDDAALPAALAGMATLFNCRLEIQDFTINFKN